MTIRSTPAKPKLRIVKDEGVATAGELQADYEASLRRRNADRLPSSTIDAIEWLLKNQTAEYFAAWFKRRGRGEQQQIAKYIAGKK